MDARELFRTVNKARTERGWGRALRTLVADWYTTRPVREVAADILACPEYNGWTHRDLLRLAHPVPQTQAQRALLQWAAEGALGHLATPDVVAGELRQVYAVERLKRAGDEREVLAMVEQYSLTHHMLPEEWKRSPAVWESLLTSMSYSDIVENLIAMADSELLVEECEATALVVARMIDRRRIQASGIAEEELIRARAAYIAHPRAIRVVVGALDAALDMVRR